MKPRAIPLASLGLGLGLALVVASCTSKDATYCDAQTPCADARDVCNLQSNLCERAPQRDAGSVDAPATDAAAADAAPDDAAAADGAADGTAAGDDAGGDAAAGDAAGAGDAGADDAGADDAGAGDAGGDAGCVSPQRLCGTVCYDLDDPTHCGPGCTSCTVPQDGYATCDGTSCGFGCNSGYWSNGSSCDPCTTTAHCGASCVPCTPPQHAQATCSGSCGFTCDPAWWSNGTSCDPCNTAAHCGTSCAPCSGTTPDCQGGQSGKCVCNVSSCGGTTPVCDSGTGACRACGAHTECASGVCGDNGACVAATSIIYLRPTACNDSGPGDEGTPYCSMSRALAEATTTVRYHILVRAGYYHVTATQQVQARRVVIVGVAPNQTLLAQDTPSIPILSLLQFASVWISNMSLIGASGVAGHGVICDGAGVSDGSTHLTLDDSNVSSNGGNGIDAAACAIHLHRSTLGGNQGLGLRSSASWVFLSQTKIQDNHGGGLHLVGGRYGITNCLIAKNGTQGPSGSAVGGAKLESVADYREFVHNTVAGNYAATSVNTAGVWCTGGYYDLVRGSIIYSNYPAQQLGCSLQFSDVQDGNTANGNITGNPLFVDWGTSDFHLSTSPTPSPCINAGSPSGAPTVDLDGYPRSGNPDMGCYEAH